MEDKTHGMEFAALFAAGAAKAAHDNGLSEKDAEALVSGICKEAARGRYNFEDVDDEDNTFWSRNKKWLIPTIVGSLAFYVGANGERYPHSRRDRSYLSNSGRMLWDRLKTLFGYDNDPIAKAMTDTPKDTTRGGV